METQTIRKNNVDIIIIPKDNEFESLFNEIWEQILRESKGIDTKTIIDYWRINKCGRLPAPIITIASKPVDKIGHGAVNMEGFLIRFESGPVGNRSCKEIRESIISHEFAHVFVWARNPDETRTFSTDKHEEEAKKIQIKWGFTPLPDLLQNNP